MFPAACVVRGRLSVNGNKPQMSNELETLKRVCDELKIELEPAAFKRLDALRTLLLDYNLHTNLTAIRDPLDVEIKLFADSLALMPLIQAEMLSEGREAITLIDIGTGAGFPGLPIAIANPAIQVTLVDSTKKKVTFIEHVAEKLNLGNVIPVHARSEEIARQDAYRERFDIVTARALASLPALIELCLPLIRVGGLALLTKGRDIQDEVRSASRALKEIGGEHFDTWQPDIMELENTSILQVRKYKPTSKKYPRSVGVPVRSPL
jgi:16S rRNA (guanine527-N7)-methyltransferase